MELSTAASIGLVICVFLATCASAVRQSSNVYVDESGGYNGILVAVDPHVQYDSSILTNIQGYITLASNALHAATNHETLSPRYFHDVTILLPNTWPQVSHCRKVTAENAAHANFLVAEESSQWGSAPHTVRMDNQCGTTDGFTTLPISFIQSLTEARKYGANIGKTLLHEWAHQRYGVYDESGPETCLAFEGGYTFPKRCSDNIRGETHLQQGGKKCSFTPYAEQNNDAKTSLMYMPYLETARTFCDGAGVGSSVPRHNENITNEHNDRCGGRSVSQILRAHPDFSSVRITPSDSANNMPDFHCVQEDSIIRMVLTLDISRSMKSQGRLEQMQKDITTFLLNTPCSNMAVGMVEFSDFQDERTIHRMVSLSNPANVRSLIAALPQNTKDRTCIACGVRQAIQTLRDGGYDTHGAVVAVFTDGVENEDELTLSDIHSEVLNSGIVLYANVLQMLDLNEALSDLVSATGGSYCKLYDDQTTTYYDCLENILRHNAPLQTSNSVLVQSQKVNVYPGRFTTGTFIIDSRIKNTAVLQIQWVESLSRICSSLSVDLQRPDGSTEENLAPDERTHTSVVFNLLSDTYGQWTYRLRNAQHCTARVHVEGRIPRGDCSNQRLAADYATLVPYVKSSGEDNNVVLLHAKLVKGSNPIIGASVYAHITAPNGDITKIELWDNGAGADMKSLDGIYSRYFVGEYSNLYTDGANIAYNAKFDAKWTPNTKLQLSTASYGVGATSLPQFKRSQMGVLEGVERFERASVGHFFQTLNSRSIAPLPPAKITDLRLQGISGRRNSITLAWTAMGESMDSGKALEYEIKVSTNVHQLRNDFDSNTHIKLEAALTPAEAGRTEEAEVSLNQFPDIVRGTVYYAGVSSNSQNGHSEVSNVIMFILSPNKTALGLNQKEEVTQFPVWIIVFIFAVVVFLILTIAITAIIRKRAIPKKNPECQKGSMKKCEAQENHLESVSIASTKSSCYETDANTSKPAASPDLIRQIAYIKAQMRHVDGPDSLRGLGRCSTPQLSDTSSDTASDRTTSSRKPMLGFSRAKATHIPRVGLSRQRERPGNLFTTSTNRPSLSEQLFNPNEPLQNHPYSYPLFGDAAIVPEVELRNSYIKS